MEATAERSPRYRWLPWFLAVCVVGSLTLVAFTQRSVGEDTTVQRPGGLALDLFVQHPDGRQTIVRRGDNVVGGMMRLRVTVPAAGRLAIIAASEGDSIRVVHSFAAINPGKRQMLPETVSIMGRGPERLVAIMCNGEDDIIYDGDVLVAASAALGDAGGDPRKMEKVAVPCSESAVWYEKR